MEAELQRRADAGAPHAWELRWRQRLVARLEWEQDERWRERAGWYLRRTDEDGEVVAERRIDVDDSVRELAEDADSPADEWASKADAVATLTTESALIAAEWQLRGGSPDAAPSLAPARAHRYEIFVRGADPSTLGLAFPRLAVTAGAAFAVLTGTLDPAGLDAVLDRCMAIGCTVIGVVGDRGRATGARPAR